MAERKRQKNGAREVMVLEGQAVYGYPWNELGEISDEYKQGASIASGDGVD